MKNLALTLVLLVTSVLIFAQEKPAAKPKEKAQNFGLSESMFTSGQACDATSVKGLYGYSTNGVIRRNQNGADGYHRLSEIGQVSFDGIGSVTLRISRMEENQGVFKPTYIAVSGNYDLAKNCTGKMQLNYNDGSQYGQFDMTIVHEGAEIETLFRNPNVSLAFTQKRQ
jgi:hypothetical protein